MPNGSCDQLLTSSPRYACYVMLLGVMLLSSAWGQDTTGKIEGHVVDRRKDLPLAGHSVILKVHQGDTVQQRETTTDSNGRYVFEGLSTAYDMHYDISTTYEGEEHLESDIVLSEWVPTVTVDVEIGGFVDDPAVIRVRQHTLVITPPPEGHAPDGAVSVMEILQVENTADREFQTLVDNQVSGISLNLPAGHEDLRIDQIFKQQMDARADRLVAAEPLPPGKHNMGYSYVMHVDANRGLNLARQFAFDTDQIYVFVAQGVPLVPQTNILGAGRQEQIHDMVYTVYATSPAQPFKAGDTPPLSLRVTASRNASTGNAASPNATSDPKMVAMIAIAAALAGGFLVAGILRVRKVTVQPKVETPPQPTASDEGWLRKLDAADLERTRIARLEMITRLEELHEKRELSERVYNRLRKEQVDRLTAVLEHLKTV